MRTHHFIPKAEEEIHEASEDCWCEPALISQYRLEDCSWAGEVVWEHQTLLPDEMQIAEDGWVAFVSLTRPE